MAAIEILIQGKNQSDAAFKAVTRQLEATSNEAKKTSLSMDSVTARAGKLSDAIGRTSTTLARSADAFGLSAGAMRTIGDVADVAQLGFDNLSSSAAGFNAASFAVVGAGLAIGTALGKMAMQFDVVRENAYAAGEAVHNAFSSQRTQSVQEMAAATANWAIEQKKVAAANEEFLRRITAGKSAEEVKAILFPEPPKGIRERILEDAKAFEEAQKKKEAAAKRAAEVAAAAAKQASAERLRAVEEENRLREHTAQEWDKFFATLAKEETDLTDWVKDEAQARTDAIVKGLAEEMLAAREAAEDRRQSYEDMSVSMLDAIKRRRQAELDAQEDMANALGQLGDLFESFGGSAGEALASIAHGFSDGLHAATAFAEATNVAQKAMAALSAAQSAFNSGSAMGGAAAGASFGAQFGIIGAGIGAVVGGLAGLFGGASKARAEMEKLRNEFIKSAGGMGPLSAAAKAAGVSLDGMFKQKSAEALARQIDLIKSKLKAWEDAQDILRSGQEKWNIAIGDMGPKFAGLELDKRAHEMVMFFAAASGVGANMGAVTAGMAKDVNDLVAQYKGAGLAIPAAMKPMLQTMLDNKQLLDENGNAYESFEDAGITFAESMEGVLSNVADQIQKLMEVLARGFKIPIDFDVSGQPSAPSGGGGGGPHAPRDEGVPEFAGGGRVTGPTYLLAGERNPETLIPDDKMGAFLASAMRMAGAMNGGGMVIHNTVNMGTRTVWKEASQATRRRQMQVQPNSLRRF